VEQAIGQGLGNGTVLYCRPHPFEGERSKGKYDLQMVANSRAHGAHKSPQAG
jgi:hypothetical protein